MRLTVGPLPAAVYWRRRGVVLVGLAMVVLVVSYACGGPTESKGAQTAATTTPPADASPTSSAPHPIVPSTTPPSPTATAFTLVTGAATGPCTDGEIELTASAASATASAGQEVLFTIKIKNVSDRTCSRDVGADPQELRLQDTSGIVWSSDDCNARHGADIRSFAPGTEVQFSLTWLGKRSRSGTGAANCTTATPPTTGVYDLIARLDKKLSPAFALKIE